MIYSSCISFLKHFFAELFWDGKEDPAVIPGKKAVQKKPRRKDLLGREGETIAAEWYRKNGCTLLDRNLRLPSCEIDLILRDGGELVFAEVKTRRGEGYSDPYTEVPPKRRERMKRAKKEFLRWKTLPSDTPCRFDIVMVIAAEGRIPEIRHLKDAF